MVEQRGVCVLGIYVADTSFVAPRLPVIGETLMGEGFALGPGGKGSNQAVAAARAGAETRFISKIGNDPFGAMAQDIYADAGVIPELQIMDDTPTGAAFVFVNSETGDNAVIVTPGAAGTLTAADVEAKRAAIEGAQVFVTQMEQPEEAARAGLEIAHAAGVRTVFNPAPAGAFDAAIYPLCDFIAPNETEAAALVGFSVETLEDARKAGEVLCKLGAGCALITMGSQGVYVHNDEISELVPAVACGAVVDTCGAGDSFIGSFSAALAEGQDILSAVQFGTVSAGIAVTRRGTAAAMATRAEITARLAQ